MPGVVLGQGGFAPLCERTLHTGRTGKHGGCVKNSEGLKVQQIDAKMLD